MKRILLLIFSLAIMFAQSLDLSSLKETALFLNELKNEPHSIAYFQNKLDDILKHRSYAYMFEHYNRSWRPNHLPKSVFRDMILSLKFKSKYTQALNERADSMFPIWEKAYLKIDSIMTLIEKLECVDTEKLMKNAIDRANHYLDESSQVPEYYLFINFNGGSNGFAFKSMDGNLFQGLDFLQLKTDSSGKLSFAYLEDIISHESHHLAFRLGQSENKNYRLFISSFLAEGIATKFINQASLHYSNKITEEIRPFDYLYTKSTRELWKSYITKRLELFKKFKSTLDSINSIHMDTNKINEELRNYWLNAAVGKAYYLGAEIIGIIYRAKGKKTIFNIIESPDKLLNELRDSIRILKIEELNFI